MSRSKGFVFVELAIALPLMILLMYALTLVGTKIFEQGREQLADYTLDEEAHHLLERIVYQARAAKEVEAHNDWNGVKFIYHAADDGNVALTFLDVWETQWYLPHEKSDTHAINLYAKRQNDGKYSTPITGANSFGLTSLVKLNFRELNENVLHITLEMESLVTKRKIKLSTAVYMPACKSKSGLSDD